MLVDLRILLGVTDEGQHHMMVSDKSNARTPDHHFVWDPTHLPRVLEALYGVPVEIAQGILENAAALPSELSSSSAHKH